MAGIAFTASCAFDFESWRSSGRMIRTTSLPVAALTWSQRNVTLPTSTRSGDDATPEADAQADSGSTPLPLSLHIRGDHTLGKLSSLIPQFMGLEQDILETLDETEATHARADRPEAA